MIFDTMLITGCGGDIAQSLARIARASGAVRRLVGCDIHHDHAGTAFFDTCAVVPRASDAAYLIELERLIANHEIDVVVPVSDAELQRLHMIGALENFSDVPIIAANRLAVQTGLDKYATFERLSRFSLGVPWTRICGSGEPIALPCILKPRHGQGSKGLQRVETQAEVENLSTTRAGDIWQELLLPDDQEYTCGLYKARTGETRKIVFRRQLQGGLTGVAEVVDNTSFDGLLDGIADALDLTGSINVQLRLTEVGAKVFEINARFSSTVGFRNSLGFRDFIWSLLDRRALAIEDYCPPAVGTRVYRCSSEVIIIPDS